MAKQKAKTEVASKQKDTEEIVKNTPDAKEPVDNSVESGDKAPEVEMIDHIVTAEDLEGNSLFDIEGLEVGDIIQIPKEDAKDETPNVVIEKNTELPGEEAKPKGEGKFHVVVETGNETFEYDTDDIGQSLIDLKFTHFKTKTVIKVSYGGKTIDRVMFVAQARRFFNNPMSAEIFEKNIKLALNAV